MLKVALTRLLQHLIAQNNWAQELLLPFAGKSLQFKVSMFQQTLVVLDNGQLAISGETNLPDAVMTLSPTTILRLLAKDEAANRQVSITGDTQLASAFAQVFTHARWDVEDDLSRLIGDIPANQVVETTKKMVTSVQKTSVNAVEMATEFLQEEKPFIAKKIAVENFNAEVDTLRADVARFEKKLDKLIKRAQQLHSHKTFS